ncbi:VPLPA-CTERM sorting domain-containing protein [Tateyamaria armeniaca]|uniref:VPLPA-CTERM sorting domain-containing protein n=1 Tax=Tateyamaria armeniaca TaxID=2518930 RepID=A0ABW8UX16_9RHOB
MKRLTSVCAFALCVAGSVQAATTTETIGLFGSGGTALSYSNFGDSFGLVVTAWEHNQGVLGNARNVGRWSTGLGARLIGSTSENHQVDGGGPDEIIIFDFGQTVTLESVTFSYVSAADDFELGAYASTLSTSPTTYFSDLAILPLSTTDGTYDNEGGDLGQSALTTPQKLTASVFGIGADHRGDSFKINSITVSFDNGEDTSPVPLPATGLLLIGALGGLTAMRRRKTTSG